MFQERKMNSRFYCSFVVSSVRTILVFIRRIVCPYDFTVHSSYRLSVWFYCSFVVSSVRTILLFIHRIVCPYDFTVHSSYRLSVRIYCSFVVSSVFLLFIVCCHFLLIHGKIYISRSRHYFGNPNGQNLDLCVGNLL